MDPETALRAPELPYLEAFHAVCTLGGFTAAARQLGCTQPTISYRIRRLEALLGARLLERDNRRVVLTPEGERLRALMGDMMAELARLRGAFAGGDVGAPLRIGAASGFGRYVLVPALHALRVSQPYPLEIRLQYDAADAILDGLDSGRHDAAFVYKQRISSALLYDPVYAEELVLIGGATLAAEARRHGLHRLDTFRSIPFVTYEECEYVFGRWFENAFSTQPSSLASAAHFTELEEVVDFVSCDVGLSIVPRDAAAAACAGGRVELLYAGRGEPCLNQVFAVTRAGSRAGPELARLIQILRSSGQESGTGASGSGAARA